MNYTDVSQTITAAINLIERDCNKTAITPYLVSKCKRHESEVTYLKNWLGVFKDINFNKNLTGFMPPDAGIEINFLSSPTIVKYDSHFSKNSVSLNKLKLPFSAPTNFDSLQSTFTYNKDNITITELYYQPKGLISFYNCIFKPIFSLQLPNCLRIKELEASTEVVIKYSNNKGIFLTEPEKCEFDPSISDSSNIDVTFFVNYGQSSSTCYQHHISETSSSFDSRDEPYNDYAYTHPIIDAFSYVGSLLVGVTVFASAMLG